ncbi:E3 ubiquitin-protein ligase FANCL-like [Asparagus officinalis]|uniref:E3 ubiquitin-protein ligase FANCL-like n=1 Tax=Asparagus officinalis TaxID=4686 RepID=UPI00098E2C20|nr:E3 ubiquitin-protein ligase FANCL-like [Asparagus officinalis]
MSSPFSCFVLRDKKGRAHTLEITLPRNYPHSSPSIFVDVPYIIEFEWSKNSRLKDIVRQFNKHLEKLQEFWSTMDEIDRSLWVMDPKQPSNAASHRRINLGNECYLLLSIDAHN